MAVCIDQPDVTRGDTVIGAEQLDVHTGICTGTL
jgi:hypothetical protein